MTNDSTENQNQDPLIAVYDESEDVSDCDELCPDSPLFSTDDGNLNAATKENVTRAEDAPNTPSMSNDDNSNIGNTTETDEGNQDQYPEPSFSPSVSNNDSNIEYATETDEANQHHYRDPSFYPSVPYDSDTHSTVVFEEAVDLVVTNNAEDSSETDRAFAGERDGTENDDEDASRPSCST
jgi:hypothetical protein